MKLINFNKNKNNKKFNPMKHWYLILITSFLLSILIISYSVYIYFYIKNEIVDIENQVRTNVQNSTSSNSVNKNLDNKNFLNNVNNLKNTIEVFEKKELEYLNLTKLANETVLLSTTTSSTTSTTTFATSTN